MSHLANAYSLRPGHCFRLVTSPVHGQEGAPTHCPEPPGWWGRWRNGAGEWLRVEACGDHAHDLHRAVARPG
jgi:hypothetical protein